MRLLLGLDKNSNHLIFGVITGIVMGLLCLKPVTAQQYRLSMRVAGDSAWVDNNLNFDQNYNTVYEVRQSLNKKLKKLHRSGFLSASFDTLMSKDSTVLTTSLWTGPKYEWLKLKKGNVPKAWLSATGFRDQLFTNQVFHYPTVAEFFDAILQFAEKNGYPFAQISLEQIKVKDGQIAARLNLNKKQRIYFDEVTIFGNANVDKTFLRNYLDLQKGAPYNEESFKKLKTRIDELLFIKSDKSPDVYFERNKANINLYLDKREASRFNGILGLAPRSQNSNDFLLTGEIALHLLNPFGKGMNIDFQWRKIQQNSQRLDVKYHYPYVFGLPIGADFSFDLYKFDTVYLDLNYSIGLRYLFSGTDYLRVFYERDQSRLLSEPDETNITRIPDFTNYNVNYYGLELNWEELDYRLNPTQGYTLNLNTSVGQKNLTNKPESGEINDSLKPNSLIIRLKFEGRKFFQLGQRSTFLTKFKGAHLMDDQIFDNQLFRIGGLQSLRGFNEESIDASSYGVGTIEYRYLTGKEAFLSIFADGAYIERQVKNTLLINRPIGMGLGYNFKTRAGVFSLNYAIGKRQSQSLDPRNSKIHFGFTNRF